MRKMLFVGGVLAVLLAAGIGMAASTASAHEGREVGDYRLVVGWWEEPTYEGHRNAVLVRVTRLGSDEGDHDAEDSNAEDGHHHDSEDEDTDDGHHHDADDEDSEEDDHTTKLSVAGGKMASPAPRPYGSPEVPVEGLQGSLLVEVTHVSSESSRVLNVRAMPDEPGSYVADLIPTAAGVYQVRVFGAIEGTRIDETFVSEGGGGRLRRRPVVHGAAVSRGASGDARA